SPGTRKVRTASTRRPSPIRSRVAPNQHFPGTTSAGSSSLDLSSGGAAGGPTPTTARSTTAPPPAPQVVPPAPQVPPHQSSVVVDVIADRAKPLPKPVGQKPQLLVRPVVS
ncbi:unnamed protein product, partial [Amoebophrya sp. A25]